MPLPISPTHLAASGFRHLARERARSTFGKGEPVPKLPKGRPYELRAVVIHPTHAPWYPRPMRDATPEPRALGCNLQPDSPLRHRYVPDARYVGPESVTFRDVCPPALDQGNIGRCVSDAIVGAAYALMARFAPAGEKPPLGSGAALYKAIRARRQSGRGDDGATIAEGLQAGRDTGLVRGTIWPSTPDLYHPEPEPEGAAQDRGRFRVLSSAPIERDAPTLKHYLAGGFPVLVGIRTYPTFDNAEAWETGDVRMPTPEMDARGGHAFFLNGFEPGWYHFQNSWGPRYGILGCGRIAAEYIEGFLCSEAHALLSARFLK